jgi:hypothetical protein
MVILGSLISLSMTFLIMWLIYSLIKLVKSTENSMNKIVVSLERINMSIVNAAPPSPKIYVDSTKKKNRVVGKTEEQLAFEENRKLDRKS